MERNMTEHNAARATARKERHRRHANPFTVRGPMAVPHWDAIYGRQAPLALDVGCGPGRFVVELAAKHPEWNVLGLEIREHLVASTLAMAKEAGLANVHALVANANMHLPSILPPQSVAFLAVNFPDPWYKKRHQKRRVVRPDWLTTLEPALMPGASIHAMSDYLPIALEMREVLTAQPGFFSLEPKDTFAAESTTGLTTEREIIHQRRGEPIYRMRFTYGLAKNDQF